MDYQRADCSPGIRPNGGEIGAIVESTAQKNMYGPVQA
jgi:hypothetical protein